MIKKLIFREALWIYELPGVNPVGIPNAIALCQVIGTHTVIERDPTQRITAADYIIIAIIWTVGRAAVVVAVVVSVIVSTRDIQYLSGINIRTDSRICSVHLG